MSTIAAISTPQGIGGVALIRVSGPDALSVAARVLRRDLKTLPPRKVFRGTAHDPRSGAPLDDVLFWIFRAPHSYTGEDLVEISTHGGLLIPRLVLEALIEAGARLAEPGEFTKRAFLNGKMDLVQASAVQELVQALSPQALRLARAKLEGKSSDALAHLRERLYDLLAEIEARIDFEEEVPDLPENFLPQVLTQEIDRVDRLIEEGERSRAFFQGIPVAIVGRPNVGKSTLFNRLVGKDRAIVTEIPGTTRDLLTEHLILEGIPVVLYDTAGWRETQDPVERIGVRRAQEAAAQARITLVVLDGHEGVTPEDRQILRRMPPEHLIVVNKKDLGLRINGAPDLPADRTVRISALTGEGLPELLNRLRELLKRANPAPELSFDEREILLLRGLRQELEKAQTLAKEQAPLDLIAFHIRAGIRQLDSILGYGDLPEEILNRVFSRFCIGK